MRVFLELSYCGASFHGWQIQPGVVTVQSVIEDAIGRLAGEKIDVVGAGRTDAGVNARQMIAHVDLPEGFDVGARFLRSLNAIVGRDIAVHSARIVAPDAHARFDAVERSYRYFVHTAKNPFLGDFSWQAPPSLDFESMNKAASLILGRRDFTSFSKLHTDVKTNICDLRQAQWRQFDYDNSRWYFEIVADRFLRNMVRAVVGTLVDIGRGKYAPEGIIEILNAADRCAAGTSMPAKPLFLWSVKYPF